MKVFHSSRDLPPDLKGAYVAIGNFDGVHVGHQEIIRALGEKARTVAAPLLVYTFWPHPAKILVPKAAPKMIQTQVQKIKVLEALGVSAVIFEPFDTGFSRLSARAFFDEVLVARLRARHIAVGYDFTFGYHREGTAQALQTWASAAGAHGMGVTVVEPFFCGETLASSKSIRQLLSDGEVEEAAKLLGRPYEYAGTVVAGDARGKRLGFPTANLAGDLTDGNEMLLKEGVYATWVEIRGRHLPSVTNVGSNPTFAGDRPVHVEVHILDFPGDSSGDLYGQTLSVFFARRLRGERRFVDIDALRAQIEADIAETRKALAP